MIDTSQRCIDYLKHLRETHSRTFHRSVLPPAYAPNPMVNPPYMLNTPMPMSTQPLHQLLPTSLIPTNNSLNNPTQILNQSPAENMLKSLVITLPNAQNAFR